MKHLLVVKCLGENKARRGDQEHVAELQFNMVVSPITAKVWR